MPCQDSSSILTVKLDHSENILDFEFSKITCNKEIGGGTGYRDYCVGKPIRKISSLQFSEVLEILRKEVPEEQFFLYLEWDAIKNALAQYAGNEGAFDSERYQLSSISYEEEYIEIRQIILPVKDMPKIVSCFKRGSNQKG